MNRELPPGDRGNRSSDSGWQSRPPGSVPGTRGLVCRAKNPPKGATPPGTSPAARERQNKRDSGFERVGSFFVLAFCGRERQTHFLPIAPDRNPRPLWACQEVAFISSASVVLFGRFRSSRTFSVLLPFREPDSFLAALAAFVPLVAFLAGVAILPDFLYPQPDFTVAWFP